MRPLRTSANRHQILKLFPPLFSKCHKLSNDSSHNMMKQLFLAVIASNSLQRNHCRCTIACTGYARHCNSYNCFLKLLFILKSQAKRAFTCNVCQGLYRQLNNLYTVALSLFLQDFLLKISHSIITFFIIIFFFSRWPV